MYLKIFMLLLFSSNLCHAFGLESWVKDRNHPLSYTPYPKEKYIQIVRHYLADKSLTNMDFITKKVGKIKVIYDPNEIHPTIIINEHGSRDLMIEVPHAAFEPKTKSQGVRLFKNLDAKVLLISGAHRCASEEETQCSGTTSVCGKEGKYKISDAAHAKDHPFQLAHIEIMRHYPSLKVVQLHQMKNSESPYKVVVSTGLRQFSKENLSNKLRTLLRGELRDSTPVSCNDPSDIEKGFRELCGHTNLQGRFLNGSDNACDEGGEFTSDKFLHVSQESRVMDNPLYQEGFERALSRL